MTGTGTGFFRASYKICTVVDSAAGKDVPQALRETPLRILNTGRDGGRGRCRDGYRDEQSRF
jgi:hypothetical protein